MITYRGLREIQRSEKDEVELTSLEDNFFEQISEYFNNLKVRKKELSSSTEFIDREAFEQISQELLNSEKVLKNFLESRERKIVNKAISSVRVYGQFDVNNLTSKEKELFKDVENLFKKHRKLVLKSINEHKVEKVKENKDGSQIQEFKMLEEVNEFVWSDGKVYGPFKVGENIKILSEIGLFLVENRKAENL